jgi:Uma2 family endonuclease
MSRPGLVTHPREVEYPESDGQPMGETGLHVRAILTLLGLIDEYYRDRDDVYVTGDMFLYYEQGNPRAVRSPDVLVAFGVPKLPERRSFFTWREKVVPQVLFEMSSESTVEDDLGPNRELYERLGVQEYFLFDPTGESLTPRLQGFRRAGDGFVRLELDAGGALTSEVMGLRLVPEGILLRPYEVGTGRKLLTLSEESALREQRERELAEERQRRDQEQRLAEQERQRAEQERERAEQERQRADALAAELARLRAQLGQAPPPQSP